jgi:hypothetical protein
MPVEAVAAALLSRPVGAGSRGDAASAAKATLDLIHPTCDTSIRLLNSRVLRPDEVQHRMEFNRNHYFLAGLVILMMGIQMRTVDSFVLSSDTTKFLAARIPSARGATFVNATGGAGARKTLRPPEWLGWSMLSIGSVLILHSLAMPKP